MNDFQQIISHQRRFKSAVKDMTLEQLEDIQTKLEKIIDEKIAEIEAEKANNAEKLEAIEQINQILADKKIGIEELTQLTVGKKRSKRAPRPPKYAIVNAEGERITWTGQGRMPNVFKEQIEKGGKQIEDFLI